MVNLRSIEHLRTVKPCTIFGRLFGDAPWRNKVKKLDNVPFINKRVVTPIMASFACLFFRKPSLSLQIRKMAFL